jgi:hypothetical protein
MLEGSRRKRRHSEKIYCASALFIGVRGVVSRKHLDMTVAIFPGGTYPLRCSEGDVFFTEIQDFIRGIGSSESTRFPEGLVLGNWTKTLHPRNVGFAEFMNNFVNHLQGGKLCFVRRKHS